MVLPETGDWLEEITFTELPETEAKAEVEKYNKEGKDAGYGYQPRGRGDYRGNQFRWNPNSSRRMY